jgi:hypothetical protein
MGRSLAQIMDGDFPTLHDLHGKLAAMEHTHPKERMALYGTDGDGPGLAMPRNDCVVDRKDTLSPINQDPKHLSVRKQTEAGNCLRRQREEAREPGINEDIGFQNPILRSSNPEADYGFEPRIDLACEHRDLDCGTAMMAAEAVEVTGADSPEPKQSIWMAGP